MRAPDVDRLPRPQRERWQPLRAGLVDLFHYDREEFWFRDGHLLLRGNNGTGKSKVLALMLPFLLDGETAPYRVEPDGDSKKRMEWNLLLGGRHAERTGYTWLELGRQDADGDAVYVTIGAGLRATRGKAGVQTWFFVTDRRVGDDLFLVSSHRAVVPRDRLREVLAERGEVYDRAADYRRAVDERLFHLGQERYDSLLSLLIQLRQPQLSKRPDERRLSDALTEALAPLDQALLADVAESFRSLDDERSELAVFTEAGETAGRFLDDYRRYAQIAARRHAEGPREAQSRYEATGRLLTEARRARDDAAQEISALKSAQAQTVDQLSVARAEKEALADSDLMRDARQLQRLADDARQLEQLAERSAREAEHARTTLERQQQRAEEATRRLDDAERAETEQRDAVVEAAGQATVGALDPAVDDAPRRARHEAGRRGDAVATVQRLVDDEAVVMGRHADARRRHADAEQQAERARANLESSRTARSEAADAFTAAAESALSGAAQAAVPDAAAVVDAVRTWADTLDEADPARTALGAAADAARERLAAERHRLTATREGLLEQRQTLEQERRSLEAGEARRPPVPHTRDERARADRDGAPLWRVVDFVDDLPDADRAGIEAALEASGVLDGWVTPDGTLVDADDTMLVADQTASEPLSRLLRPAVDHDDAHARTVSEQAIRAVLAGIGVGPAGGPTSWVDTTGDWQLGVLRGRWRKPSAEYVGAGAREQARRRRLAEITDRVAELDETVAVIDSDIQAVDRHRAQVAEELAAYPSDQRLRDAHAEVLAAVRTLHERVEAVETFETEVRRRRSEVTQARQAVEEAASDLRLPADADGLSRVRRALTTLEAFLPSWESAIRSRRLAADDASDARVEVDEAAEAHRRADEAGQHDRQRARDKRAEHDALHASAGAAVQELQQRLDAVARRIEQLARERDRLGQRLQQESGTLGVAKGKVEELERQLADHDERRRAAVSGLRRFAAGGLLAVALPDLDVPDPAQEWAPTPAVTLARRIDNELDDVHTEDRAWDRAGQRVSEQLQSLQDALSRSGGGASYRASDEGLLVSAQWRGSESSVPALVTGLADEVAERQRLLSAREQEILENHLVDHVAAELQTLIEAAERQVAAMNEELADRPTSTGMTLRLVWHPAADGPEGLAEVRARLLRQDAAAWSQQDRQAIGRFLQARITQMRQQDETGTWLEHLTAALNYRTWHRFSIERYQDGRWRPATGPSSAGERALAATIPLCAAASSYYRSAGSAHAPRLVMLDEAFAGVDDDSRAKCLGLLDTFDLDYVLTSEREWGCYSTVPGLAIAHLTRRDGIDAVLVSSWEWDGTRRERVERTLPPLHASSDAPDEVDLFS
ncbi:MAG TPA: TIGR02680 family protein [Nocardioidaceae bacterium]|nr:TIGR02680 family protein [Nocardioidaceae bacterium]